MGVIRESVGRDQSSSIDVMIANPQLGLETGVRVVNLRIGVLRYDPVKTREAFYETLSELDEESYESLLSLYECLQALCPDAETKVIHHGPEGLEVKAKVAEKLGVDPTALDDEYFNGILQSIVLGKEKPIPIQQRKDGSFDSSSFKFRYILRTEHPIMILQEGSYEC